VTVRNILDKVLDALFGKTHHIEAGAKLRYEEHHLDQEVLSDESFHERAASFLDHLQKILVKSYGPFGSNTVIERTGESPVISKDGFTILKALRYEDPLDRSLHELVKKVSHNLVKTVGDGSTSAVVAAAALYEGLVDSRDFALRRKEFVDALKAVAKGIEMILKDPENKYSVEVSGPRRDEILRTVAMVSNDNDLKIGQMVADVFKNVRNHLSDIRIEIDPRDDGAPVSFSVSTGFAFDRGPKHNLYLGNQASVVLQKPLVYLAYEFYPDHLENLKQIAAAKPGHPIVVIADQYDDETSRDVMSGFLKGQNQFYLIQTYDLTVDRTHTEFIDLAHYVDADIIRDPKEFKIEQLGASEAVVLKGPKTVFMRGQGKALATELYLSRVKDLEEQIEDTPANQPAIRGELKNRLSKLDGVSIRIVVGGVTQEEKETRMFLVEDAVLACKAAISHGVGLGGNASLAYATQDFLERFDNGLYFESDIFKGISNSVIDRVATIYRDAFAKVYYEVVKDSPWTEELTVSQSHDDASFLEDFVFGPCTVEDRVVYNALTGSFESLETTEVLAPIETDVQVLRSVASIVGVMISANQFISR
jgi:chaperonin GroEL